MSYYDQKFTFDSYEVVKFSLLFGFCLQVGASTGSLVMKKICRLVEEPDVKTTLVKNWKPVKQQDQNLEDWPF